MESFYSLVSSIDNPDRGERAMINDDPLTVRFTELTQYCKGIWVPFGTDVRLGDALVLQMPENGHLPQPHAPLFVDHRIDKSLRRTIGFRLNGQGTHLCALALYRLAKITGLDIDQLDVDFTEISDIASELLRAERR